MGLQKSINLYEVLLINIFEITNIDLQNLYIIIYFAQLCNITALECVLKQELTHLLKLALVPS